MKYFKRRAKKKERIRNNLLRHGEERYNAGMAFQKNADEKIIGSLQIGLDNAVIAMEKGITTIEKTGNASIEKMTTSQRNTTNSMVSWHTNEIKRIRETVKAQLDLLRTEAKTKLDDRLSDKNKEIEDLKAEHKTAVAELKSIQEEKLIEAGLNSKERIADALKEGEDAKSQYIAQRDATTAEKHLFENLNREIKNDLAALHVAAAEVAPDLEIVVKKGATILGTHFENLQKLSISYDKKRRVWENNGRLSG